MKAFILVLSIISFFSKCTSQIHASTLNCRGDRLEVGVAIKGFPPCSHCEIKRDSLKNGFSIVLSDSTYKVASFRIGYYSANHLLYENDVLGSRIGKGSADFLSKLKLGDFVSIECINLEKDKKVYLSTSMLILVDE